jgi:hypothetical protein
VSGNRARASPSRAPAERLAARVAPADVNRPAAPPGGRGGLSSLMKLLMLITSLALLARS